MIDTQLQSELLQILVTLPPAQQRQVVDFARQLETPAPSSLPRGTTWEELRPVCGRLPADAADEMERAIEEYCERIDANEW